EQIDTMVIAGPKIAFNDSQLRAINDFLKRGGALLVLLDGVTMEQGLTANKNVTGLDELLKKYGITVNQDLVGDVRNSIASFTQGFMTFRSNYAFWPKITNEGFNQQHSAVANLENVTLLWASSVAVDTNQINEDNFKYLFSTTEQGWHVSDNFNVSPNSANVPQGEQKQFNLAASLSGSVKNPYASDSEEASEFNARIIVVGDSDFITDSFISNNPDNLTLFLNLVDSMSFDEDLINIRSKGVTSRPITADISDGSKAAIRYLNIFGLTMAVIVFGLVRYFIRRRSRFVDEI
ncbi:MAG: Gldg family protein, partial [Elusimicrobiales bacterium]|nr:Gldg family protein [Elusimicrobiales bacterium]